MARRAKKVTPFEFTFEGKKFRIRQDYNAQPATLVLSNGKILQVTRWKLVPTEPDPDHVEKFDPSTRDAADLAASRGGFLAELVEEK